VVGHSIAQVEYASDGDSGLRVVNRWTRRDGAMAMVMLYGKESIHSMFATLTIMLVDVGSIYSMFATVGDDVGNCSEVNRGGSDCGF
jgi:hypothetical protein